MSFSRYLLCRRRNIVRLLIFSMIAYVFYISLVGFGKMDNYTDDLSNDNVEYNQNNIVNNNDNNNNNNINNQFLPHQINDVKKRDDIEVKNQLNDNQINNVVAQPENNDDNNHQNINDNSEKIRNILTIIDKYDNFKDYQNIKDNGIYFFFV